MHLKNVYIDIDDIILYNYVHVKYYHCVSVCECF